MDIDKVLLSNYLPYAKGTIIGRAIPAIDGLKPAQRRILYTMYKMGLLKKNKTKSSNIIGKTMELHPHGDMSIYDTMVRMTTGNGALNVPYIESKGNFGKVYSSVRSLAYAAPRYTEAKLADICNELFEHIDEGAVDFIDNHDSTLKEPVLLPVKFPSILVNASSGIAVSTSSNIPSFNLSNVCNATIGVLNRTIKDLDSLAKVLGVPEFTTGGHTHASVDDLKQLLDTGRQSFNVSGSVTTYANSIVIHEIPYRTTDEAILEAIEDKAKSGELKEVSSVSDETDLNGFKIKVGVKRGYDSSLVLAKLCRYTNLRMPIHFITRVIINDRCEEFGVLRLLEEWINFRLDTIKRIYEYKLSKARAQEHLDNAWEKIKDNIKEISGILANGNEEQVRDKVKGYGLNDIQIDYVMGRRIKEFTQDNLGRKLKDLEKLRAEMVEITTVVNSVSKRKQMVIKELEEIRDKYGEKSRTQWAEPIKEETLEEEKEVIDSREVNVVLTKGGYIKRLITLKDTSNFTLPEGEEVDKAWTIKNNQHILVFTKFGDVHKIAVNTIDASKGGLKDKITNILNMEEDDILYVDESGDYSGYFNVVYSNGRGTRVYYSRASGNRDRYKNLFKHNEGGMWVTEADQFFMITAKRKAAYCDISFLGKVSSGVAFKVARVDYRDRIYGLQPIENVPDMRVIDTERYSKGYCVKIGDDKLWHTADSTDQ